MKEKEQIYLRCNNLLTRNPAYGVAIIGKTRRIKHKFLSSSLVVMFCHVLTLYYSHIR